MADEPEHNKPVTETIKSKLRLLNQILLLVIAVLTLVFLRFLYSFLNYIPFRSVQILLFVTAALGLAGFLLFRTVSKHALRTIDEYSKKLSSFFVTTRNIHEIAHSDTLLENIMNVSLRTTDADAGSVLLIEGDNLVFKMIKGKDAKNLKGFAFPKNRGMVGWVAENGGILRLQNAGNDVRFDPAVDVITGRDTKSVLCMPLKSGKGIMGALELIKGDGAPFTAEDEEAISYFADQAAIAIDKVRFLEDERNYEIHLTNILIEAMEYMPEKRGHSKRVAKYALLMARVLNMSEAEMKRLYYASLLHDIGFLKIRQETASLQEMRQHPRIAYEMLLPITFYSEVAPIVLHHHEWYDGSGYPSGMKGESIPIESRMIFIAEVFDTIVSENSYRKIGKVIQEGVNPIAVGFRGAVEEIRRNEGTQFDPELAELFVNNISEDYIDK